jgi:WD40 repeat protein
MLRLWAGLVALVGSVAVVACSGGAGTGGSGGGSGNAGKGGGGTAGNAAGGTGGAPNPNTGPAFPNGIGSGSKWTSGVVAHVGGPYAPCGIVGTGTVVSGAANPTVPELAAASRSGVVLFFSTETGEQTRAPYYAGAPVSGVDYSSDGTELVVASDKGIQLVRLSDRTVLFNTQPFAAYAVAAALSPDGSMIAAVGRDVPQTVTPEIAVMRLLRVSDGTSIAERPVNTDGAPPQFSSDGGLVVAADEILSVPDLQIKPWLGYAGHIALSPDGTLAAQEGHVIALASGHELKGTPAGESGIFTWAAFSPDGATYVEAYNETFYLWRTADWTAIGTPTAIEYFPGGSVTEEGRFFTSGDGTHLVSMLTGVTTANGDYAVFQILSLPGLTQSAAVVEPHLFAGPVVFSPDGSLLASRLETSGGVWRATDLSLVSRLPDVIQESYSFLANGTLEVWPLSIDDPLTGTKLGGSLGSAVSPDGTLALVLTPSQTSVVRLADLSTQAVVDASALRTSQELACAFSRDNRFLALAPNAEGSSAQATVFDTATGAPLVTVAGGAPLAITTTSSGAVRLAAFLPDPSSPFATTVRVWSIPDGTPLFDVQQASADGWAASSDVPTMAFSPDGSLLAVGVDGIRIFEVETGMLRQTLPAHTDPLSTDYKGVLSLAFGATGQIASVGWDGTMRLWCSP